ncbi:hypothetical protein IFM89_032425 [Coptis chinensis]|uniref:Uncharacterized protein n=1 Tax=Coptis chinensis TaxID=261450 RepID=A0A835LXR7_9MAGN|nr:hypothetical protein IFM89_032425 [Coptis chinensis]
MLVYVVSVTYVTQLQGGPSSGMPLQNLDLAGCKKLHISEDDMDGLTSLHTLMIENIPNLASITAGLQFVTALKKFVIKNCQGPQTCHARSNATPSCFKVSNYNSFHNFAGMAAKLHFPSSSSNL